MIDLKKVADIKMSKFHLSLAKNGIDMIFASPAFVQFLDSNGKSIFEIIIQAGTVTDFASVPRVLWPVIPRMGKYSKAAAVHDYLYVMHFVHSIDENERLRVVPITRKQADQIFLILMKHLGVPRWKRHAMYLAVRLFGWAFFNKK